MLEGKILESKAKKEQMVARARTAQSTKAVNDLMSGVSGQGSVDAWERMEEKVSEEGRTEGWSAATASSITNMSPSRFAPRPGRSS